MSAEPLSPGAPGGGGARSACWEVQRAALVARCGVQRAALAGPLRGAGSRPRGPLGGAGSRPRRPLRGAGSRPRGPLRGAGSRPCRPLPGRLCAEAGGAFITARPKLRCLHCLFALGVR